MGTVKQRLIVLLDDDEFEMLKKMAIEQNRTTGNLGATVIKEFLKKQKQK